MKGTNCILPEVGKRASIKVVQYILDNGDKEKYKDLISRLGLDKADRATLTEENLEEESLNNDIVTAISEFITPYLEDFDIEKQEAMMNDSKDLADFLSSITTNKIYKDEKNNDETSKFDRAVEQLTDIKTYLDKLGAPYVGVLEFDNKENYDEALSHFTTNELAVRIKKDDNNYIITYHIIQPIKDERTPQVKTVDKIKRLSEIRGERIGYEVTTVGDNSNKRLLNNLKDMGNGEERTGRVEYNYNGQRIVSNSVSNELYGYNPNFKGSIGTFIGTACDLIGREFFSWTEGDENNELYDSEGNQRDDKTLQDFIDNNLEGAFSVKGLRALLNDFEEMEEKIKNRWGEDCIFFSGDLDLFGRKKEDENSWVKGNPDLLVIDPKGMIHVIDFKTQKINNATTYDTLNNKENYSKQISMYIGLLESYGFTVDPNPYVLQIDSYYRDTTGKMGLYYFKEGDFNTSAKAGINDNGEQTTFGSYMESHADSTISFKDYLDSGNSSNLPLYIEPRLHLNDGDKDEISDLRELPIYEEYSYKLSYKNQWASLTKEEQEALKWLNAEPVETEDPVGVVKLPETDLFSRPDLLSQEEAQMLANFLALEFSRTITALQEGYTVDGITLSRALNKKGEPRRTALSGRSRKEIYSLVGFDALFNRVTHRFTPDDDYLSDMPSSYEELQSWRNGKISKKVKDKYGNEYTDKEILEYLCDTYDNFESQQDIDKSRHHEEKLKWINSKEHQEQLKQLMYPKLIAMEDFIIPKKRQGSTLEEDNIPDVEDSVSEEEGIEDMGDNDSIAQYISMFLNGEKDAEAWSVEQRRVSTRASMAKELRRQFEFFYVLDDNDNPIVDRYGWGCYPSIDVTQAINEMNDLMYKCNTIDDMINAIENYSKISGNHWAKQLLKKINEDNVFKTKFFIYFCKDRLNYSHALAEFDRGTGKRVIRIRDLNTKNAYYVMKQSVAVALRNKDLGSIILDINGTKKSYSLLSPKEGEGIALTRLAGRGTNSVVTTVINIIEGNRDKPGLLDVIKAVGYEYKGKDFESKRSNIFREYKGNPDARAKAVKQLLLNARAGIVSEFLNPTDDKYKVNGKSVADNIIDILGAVGIYVDSKTIQQLLIGQVENSTLSTFVKNIKGVLEEFQKQSEQGTLKNTFKENHIYSKYDKLFRTVSAYIPESVEASCYRDGKTYFAYTNPSRLGSFIKHINNGTEEEIASWINRNYKRYGWFTSPDGRWKNALLEALYDNEVYMGIDARKAIKYRTETDFCGKEYSDLGPLGFLRSILHNYIGDAREQKAKTANNNRDNDPILSKTGWFAFPTMSNKPVNEFVRLPLARTEEDKLGVLMDTFKQEMDRIADVLFHFAEYDSGVDMMDIDYNDLTDEKKIGWSKEEADKLRDHIRNAEITGKDLIKLNKIAQDGKTSHGARFHFLWYLNDEMANDEKFADKIANNINLLLSSQDSEVQKNKNNSDIADFYKDVKEVIKDKFNEIIENELQYMEDLGLFDTDTKNLKGKKILTLKYQSEFGGFFGEQNGANFEDAKEQFKNKLREFISQDIIANINIIQITGGDLAYFGNSTNYQKRIAMFHSPGLHVMHDEEIDDNYLRSVYLTDENVREEISANVEAALEDRLNQMKDKWSEGQKEDFKKMANFISSSLHKALVTDGQSFNSPTSMRKKLIWQGQWNDNLQKAYKKVAKGEYDINDLGILVQPQKPLVASAVPYGSFSTTMNYRKVPIQDKNSESLLILAEALSKNKGSRNKFAAICQFMEATAKNGNEKSGIDTVHFASVNKVGKSGVIDINRFDKDFNEAVKNGKIKEGQYTDALSYFLTMVTSRKDITAQYLASLDDKSKISLDDKSYDWINDEVSRYINKEEKSQRIQNEDSSEELSREEKMYNNDFVYTIPLEDYIIQQSVPNHLLESEHPLGQLYGSQIRILGISDITPGTAFNVRGESISDSELVKEYKSLHAENINEAFEDLLGQLGFLEFDKNIKEYKTDSIVKNIMELPVNNPRRATILKNLESLLLEEISKDSRYGWDMRRACTLAYDEYGNPIDFTLPLSDPTQTYQVQMLLNSIIRKKINNERIQGGPVVQETAYDRNLHIRFNSKDGGLLLTVDEFKKALDEGKGKDYDKIKNYKGADFKEKYSAYVREKQDGIACYECYMPIPNEKLERLLINEDGSMMSFEEAKKLITQQEGGKELWNSLTQVIGYRIPTEDKYSMVPLKIVGFLPKAAGQCVMMPQEITWITGSDFDIDKMYVMLKEFDNSIDNTYYRSIKNNTKRLNELNNKKDKSEQEKAELSKLINNQHNLRILSAIFENGKRIMNGDSSAKWEDGLSLVKKNNAEATDKEKEEYKKEVDEAVKKVRKYIISNAFNEYNKLYYTSANRFIRKKIRNNRLIDLQWAVLTNKDTASKMLNPSNFDEIKSVGRKISILRNQKDGTNLNNVWNDHLDKSIKDLDAELLATSNPHNTTLGSTKLYFQHQNMQGTQMTGLFANNTVSHAFMSFQKVGIDLDKDYRHPHHFIFDGTEIGNHDNPTVLDALTDNRGMLISKTIASFLAAAVDTAKDPSLSNLNINTFTGSVAMAMARMGFDTETIGLFLSQPVVIKLTELYFKNNDDRLYFGNNAIKEEAASLGMKELDLYDVSRIQNSNLLTKKNFIKHINDDISNYNKGTDYSPNDLDQRDVLVAFYWIYRIAQDMQKLTYCTKFNSVSNAVGPLIANTLESESRVESFKEDIDNSVFYTGDTNKGYINDFTNPADVIDNDPILEAFYYNTVGKKGASDAIFGSFFPHYYTGFTDLIQYFKDNYFGVSTRIPSRILNTAVNDYVYFLLTYNNPKLGAVLPTSEKDMDSLVKGMIKQFVTIQKFRQEKADKIVPNILLDSTYGQAGLRIRYADGTLGIDVLEYSTEGKNSEISQKVRIAWSDMLTYNDPNLTQEENNMQHNFARKLFFYTLLRNGFNFSPKTLMNNATVTIKMNAVYSNNKNKTNAVCNYRVGVGNLRSLDSELIGNNPLSSEAIEKRFWDQFIRNHSDFSQIAPNISEEDGNLIVDQRSKTATIIIDQNNNYKLNKFMINSEAPRRFITITSKINGRLHRGLYELVGNSADDSKIVYKETSTLGVPKNFIEYDANRDIKESYFKNVESNRQKYAEGEPVDISNNSMDESDNSENNKEDEDLSLNIDRAKLLPIAQFKEGIRQLERQKIIRTEERKTLIEAVKDDEKAGSKDSFNSAIDKIINDSTSEETENALKKTKEDYKKC